MDGVNAEIIDRARRVRLVVLDSDGVLTDGRIIMSSDGSETRAFDVRDGFGIRMGQHGGLVFGIISGRRSEVLERRAAELNIDELHQNVLDKAECLRAILERRRLSAEAVCFVGDDWIDLPAMRLAGLAIAPADAQPAVRQAAHLVTSRDGGRGAVREAVELVLRSTGKWDEVTRRFLDPNGT